jgi:hypothetical protein
MNETTILCIALAVFVGWVVYLKLQLAQLAEQIEELSKRLKSQQQALTKAVDVAEGKKPWGRKPGWVR